MPSLRNIPILLIDIADFSKRPGLEVRRELLRALQKILTDAARFFMPLGDPWSKWVRHGTGDGYYFLFDGELGPHVALEYTQQIARDLEAYNGGATPAFQIRLRMVLAQGDVDSEGDQWLSDQFTEAERFISYGPFKAYCNGRREPIGIAATELFDHKRRTDLSNAASFPGLAALGVHDTLGGFGVGGP